jgi:hypothetical protein
MRPLVSLVEVRPETIEADYRRALALAGLDRAPAAGPWTVAAGLDGARWLAGRTCPPWQVGAALQAAAAGSGTAAVGVAAVGPGGLQAWPTAAPWGGLAGGAPVKDAAAARGEPVPFRSRARLASLEATGAEPKVPFALRHQPVLALAAADLVSPWRLEGACATLGRLILAGHPSRRGVPGAEVRAETVAVLRELFPVMGAVIDGTVWHVGPGGRTLARHVVLAGDDPVAVDAIALRLAGYRTREVPWLRLCAERELGAVEPEQMRLVGHTALLDLDFALPEPTFARAAFPGFLGRLMPGRGNRPAGSPPGGPWGALYADLAAADRG